MREGEELCYACLECQLFGWFIWNNRTNCAFRIVEKAINDRHLPDDSLGPVQT